MTDNQKITDESLFTSEQNVIDWIADLDRKYIEETGTAGLGHARTQEHVKRILYFATGNEFEVRQVIPPPTHPRIHRGR